MTRTCQNRSDGSGAPLKRRFVKLLRELLKRNGIQQKDLVHKLGITASAASQIFSGAMTPSQLRIDQLIELLKPDVDEAQLLHKMAYWLRAGRREMPSRANRRLFYLRCRSGFSEADLAQRSGIPDKRLHALENQPAALPDATELAALAAILGEEALELASPENREPGKYAEAADSAHLALLPQIGAKELSDYSGGERIGDFASRRARRFVECVDAAPDAAAVCVVPAAAIGLGGSGILKMVLSEKTPPGMEKLSLCADRLGGLFIRGRVFAAADDRRSAEWSIPLLEISYAPGRKKKI